MSLLKCASFEEALDALSKPGHSYDEVSFEGCLKPEAEELNQLLQLLSQDNNVSVQALKLNDLEIDDSQCFLFGRFLAVNATLKSLSLCKNQITDKGVSHIAKGLLKNTSLNNILLRENQIKSNGAAAFAAMLKTNKTIEVCIFSGNMITDQGFSALCGALEENPTVTILDCTDNPISNESVEPLCRLISKNHKLNSILLEGTSFDLRALKDIINSLKKNTHITMLSLPEELYDNGESNDDAGAAGPGSSSPGSKIQEIQHILRMNQERLARNISRIVELKKAETISDDPVLNQLGSASEPASDKSRRRLKKKMNMRLSVARRNQSVPKMKDENIFGGVDRL